MFQEKQDMEARLRLKEESLDKRLAFLGDTKTIEELYNQDIISVI